MSRYTKGVSKKKGLKPGSLIHVGNSTGKKNRNTYY
ncbi:hypothetical protein DFN09_002267 [Clostridium acetobutylicum]|nr:hypothetical protein [Clostridium acetobutylicum]